MTKELYGYLYMIKNLKNNKVYIGKTYKTIYERFNEHLKNAYTKNVSSKLYDDMRLYGRQTFELSLIGTFPKNELEYQEVQYIKKYNSWLDGYNQSVGGEGFIKNDPTALINDLYAKGFSLEHIAKKTCCSVEKVRRLLFRTNSDYLKKPICTFNSDGDFLKKYSCVEELSEQEGYSIKQISNSIKQNKAINGISFSYDCPF